MAGLAETLQGMETSSPRPTAMTSASRELQTGRSEGEQRSAQGFVVVGEGEEAPVIYHLCITFQISLKLYKIFSLGKNKETEMRDAARYA